MHGLGSSKLRDWHPLWFARLVHEDLDDIYRTGAHDPPEHHIPRHPLNRARGSVLGSSLFARRY